VSLLAVASAKGSPGVTTVALGLGQAWPAHRQLVVCELDPAGGDVAAWFATAAEPGLSTLAAAARRGLSAETLVDHCQRLPGGLRVLVGPPGADQARRAAAMVAPALGSATGASNSLDVIADCGRLDAESPAFELARTSSLVLLVSRPDVASLSHASAFATALGLGKEDGIGLVLVGHGPYPPAEVSEAVGAEVVALLPHDPEGATALAGGGVGTRAARRLPLLRATADLAEALADRLPSHTWTPPSDSWPASAAPGPIAGNGSGRRVAR